MNTETTPHDITPTDISDVTQELKTAVPAGYWQDARGALVPLAKIKAQDKLREKLVTKWIKRGKKRYEENMAFKMEFMDDMAAFLDEMMAVYSKQMRGAGGKGNISLVSFAGDYKIERSVQDTIGFDERLQLCAELIRNCAARWKRGSNQNLAILAEAAVEVDKAGNVSVSRLLDLRRKKIDDPEWLQAMDLLGDSMRTVASKMQVRMYERDPSGQWKAIPLNMSAI